MGSLAKRRDRLYQAASIGSDVFANPRGTNAIVAVTPIAIEESWRKFLRLMHAVSMEMAIAFAHDPALLSTIGGEKSAAGGNFSQHALQHLWRHTQKAPHVPRHMTLVGKSRGQRYLCCG
jgi:hypothetical protein